MEKEILSEKIDEKISIEVSGEIKKARSYALVSPQPELIEVYKDVFVEEDQ